jgi:peptide-methionine (R)-S-oxide reductase
MNSTALRFIPVDKLKAEGYGQYLSLFQSQQQQQGTQQPQGAEGKTQSGQQLQSD